MTGGVGAALLALATSVALASGSSCDTHAPGDGGTRPGVVIGRTVVGRGVILRVRHDGDAGSVDHSYESRQAACVVGARWPTCVSGG